MKIQPSDQKVWKISFPGVGFSFDMQAPTEEIAKKELRRRIGIVADELDGKIVEYHEKL